MRILKFEKWRSASIHLGVVGLQTDTQSRVGLGELEATSQFPPPPLLLLHLFNILLQAAIGDATAVDAIVRHQGLGRHLSNVSKVKGRDFSQTQLTILSLGIICSNMQFQL